MDAVTIDGERDRRAITRMLVKWRAFKRWFGIAQKGSA